MIYETFTFVLLRNNAKCYCEDHLNWNSIITKAKVYLKPECIGVKTVKDQILFTVGNISPPS